MKKKNLLKSISIFCAFNLLYEIWFPGIAWALTGGPSQPEVQTFSPANTSDMVDLFTGDFSYAIPLLDVGGYPVTLSYHSGTTMDEEASWVGLGWNINPGSITRNMRGYPDDFKGDTVVKSYNIRDNISAGITAGVGVELAGVDALKGIGKLVSLDFSAGDSYNNYNGVGFNFGVSPTASIAQNSKYSLTAGLGLNISSQGGATITPNIGLGQHQEDRNKRDISLLNIGTPINSRYGLRELEFSGTVRTKLNGQSGDKKTGWETSISFANSTYTPSLTLPYKNFAVSFKANIGGEAEVAEPNGFIQGYFSKQSLAYNVERAQAYGYIYSDAGNQNPKGILDFNRELDGPFHETSTNLAIPNFTYDQYVVSGEGVSGQFRPFRGDVGILRDPLVTNESLSADGGAEVGVGSIAHPGVDFSFTDAVSTCGKWSSNENTSAALAFQKPYDTTASLFENVYFKAVGEKTTTDESYFDKWGNTTAIANDLEKQASVVTASTRFRKYGSLFGNPTILNVPYGIKRDVRDKRMQLFSYLIANEARTYGLNHYIQSYPRNKNVFSDCSTSSLIVKIPPVIYPVRKPHHISEITVTNPDGRRYIYGVPVYNVFQKEVTFAVGPSNGNRATGLASYSPGTDNSTANQNGKDHYFSSDLTPGYAHAFLITGILSPDYIDINKDGITDDDPGEAIKFNYTRYATNYKWRMPYNLNAGNYHEGLLATSIDDQANYIYGEKELWYLHSIESKTFVAQFILQDRDDALGVLGENGGKDTTQKQQSLKEINLYSKEDLIKNGDNAVPIKTVHFVYSYELCPSVLNAKSTDEGKLTLKEVYFTYGKNIRGRLAGYQFGYNAGDSTNNKSYNFKNYDRWGNFKNNADYAPTSSIYNVDYPYTLQDSTLARGYATAWELTQIDLPSGGRINVTYESDDYAFVQHKRATEMYLIAGFDRDGISGPGDLLYDDSHDNDYIYIDVPNDAVHKIATTDEVREKYMDGIDTLYYKCNVNLTDDANEYIPGYALIDQYQRVSDTRFWIHIKEIPAEGLTTGSVNPITLTAWQLMRLRLPEIAYPLSYNDGSFWNLIPALAGGLLQVLDLVIGFNGRAHLSGWAKSINSGSFVRLDNPNYKKLGGGSRVKEITLSDRWSTMDASEDDFSYGQQYEYTTQKEINNKMQTISSGVAAYEPLIGGDENPYRMPIYTDEQVLCAPDNQYYIETPLGESLYPGPSVGYSSVTVKNLPYTNVKRTATGKAIHEFYTAYDFPTISYSTPIIPKRVKPNPLFKLFKIGTQDYMTASQGYVVEVNDMHGKQKANTIYDENGQEISKEQYFYFTDNDTAQIQHLSNNVRVLNYNGTTADTTMGKDIDLWEDMREQNSETSTLTNQGNLDLIFAFIPIPIPTVWPSVSTDKMRFRSAVTTKFIERYGILKMVRKTVNGSSVETENLEFDPETGQPLLTKTTNEFNDPLYTLTIPAHWGYEGMAGAYENADLVLYNYKVNDGAIAGLTSPETLLYPGDEVGVMSQKNGPRLWVAKIGSQILLLDENGKPHDSNNINEIFKILRPGRQNMASTPIGTIVSATDPTSLIVSDTVLTNVYQASATEFSNRWKIQSSEITNVACTDTFPHKSCFDDFLSKFLSENESNYFAGQSANLTVDDLDCWVNPCDSVYLNSYLSTSSSFYSLVPDPGDSAITFYQARFGNCILTISSLSSEPFHLENLTTSHSENGCMLLNDGTVKVLACMDCEVCNSTCVDFAENDTINPYKYGIYGNFRKDQDYVDFTGRGPAQATASTNIQVDGAIKDFYSFWKYNSTTQKWEPDYSHSQWVRNNKVTLYNRKGAEVENKNALDLFSSALYGYQETVPTAVAANSEHKQIAFDPFEDYYFANNCTDSCFQFHFDYRSAIDLNAAEIKSDYAHTGKYSLKLIADSAACFRDIESPNDSLVSEHTNYYKFEEGGSLQLFSPNEGSYLVSGWVKQGSACTIKTYDSSFIRIHFSGASGVSNFYPSGPIIDGWQRIESKFSVPSGATGIYVVLSSRAVNAWFDDIRILPFSGSMKSYVYDPESMRLMATLDENNYAIFYEYDDKGALIRTKRETERGIATLQENRDTYQNK